MSFTSHRRWCSIALAACAGVLSCESPVSPTPNTSLGLRVWADVFPSKVSIRDGGATLRIRVYVENPGGDTVRIRSGGPPYTFTGDPAQSRGLEESFRIASTSDALNAGPSVDYWGDSVYTFPPRHKEYAEAVVSIRQWRDGGWPVVAESLRVRSWFNGHEGSSAAFNLVP